ncbi:MAG: Zn-ribbon domain-containing OB-fold protein [Candidatus Hydrogenedentes bacterium]|nr:Zn-ribbon domain-containing OB-fold protein [Candidatus Hydrogenedentota bacterium]
MTGEPNDCFIIEGQMALPYQYFAGAVGSRFLLALRDGKKILGVRGAKSGRTVVPPRQTCERTFERLDQDWVEVGPEGTVTGFTVIRYREPYQPKEPPYVLALIRLDGADSCISHLLNCGDPACAHVGMRVRAVFAEESVDNILAIRHFEPVP